MQVQLSSVNQHNNSYELNVTINRANNAQARTKNYRSCISTISCSDFKRSEWATKSRPLFMHTLLSIFSQNVTTFEQMRHILRFQVTVCIFSCNFVSPTSLQQMQCSEKLALMTLQGGKNSVVLRLIRLR